jgi:AcrR family transcriptional regulator
MSAPDPGRRSQTARRAILDAAFALVGEVGYGRLTMEGIAARAGVGKQTIYRWWTSKAAVLFDALLMLSEGQDGSAALPDTGDLERDLRTVLRATVAELNDPHYSEPMRALSTEISRDPALAAVYEERLARPMAEIKKARLRSAQQSGQLPADLDLDLAIDLIWGPLLSRWFQYSGPLTEEYADRVVEAAVRGLCRDTRLAPLSASPGSPPPRGVRQDGLAGATGA